ncbi:MAG: 16S rRNA (adenine(1408)-N(1))-methyltransferase NpmA [Oscillospiraceae bacterium]|jgi:16S rRNA (adenine(1408)-N(1))-methyltransferase|nr:16S rRNA (adenine(1408)-N(1))-methyltransferase NpmA [Oscillospiraceae bacterium]
MILLKGKNELRISSEELEEITRKFERVVLDIGTGDGKQIYRNAKNDRSTLYIGVDPVKENMAETASKIIKKPAKGGLDNVLLVVGTIENIPEELKNCADSVTVVLPWGSLLESVVKPIAASLQNIVYAAKEGAEFLFIFTYSEICESGEIQRRNLPEINLEYFGDLYRETLKNVGLRVQNVEILNNDDIKGFASLWAKRLGYGRKRDFFKITGVVERQ